MSIDVGEKNNLYTSNPEIANQLLGELTTCIAEGRSTSGPQSKNDVDEIILWKSKAKSKNKRKKKTDK